MKMRHSHAAQSGFMAIAAVVAIVIMAALAGAVLKLGSGQQLGSAQDITSARAWQAAKAGTDWGLFQAFQPTGVWRTAADCNGNAHTLDLRADAGFWVTVTCVANDYSEGETGTGVAATVRSLRITATACNAAGANCPDDAAALGTGYAERQRQVIAFCPVGADPGDCAP